MDDLLYRWRIRRALAASARTTGASAIERETEALTRRHPTVSRDEIRRAAERAPALAAFRRRAEPALLGLTGARLCREIRFDPRWSELAAAPHPLAVHFPELGSPAIARRIVGTFLPDSPGERSLVALGSPLPSTGARASHFLVAALLEPTSDLGGPGREGIVRIDTEQARGQEELESAARRLFERSLAHSRGSEAGAARGS